MKKPILLITVVMLAMFSSCTKNNSALPKPDANLRSLAVSPALVPPIVFPTNVYLCGTGATGGNKVAKYWKNGVMTNLSDSTSDADALGMAVSGANVYVVGRDHNMAVCWKNGVEQILGSSHRLSSQATAVIVSSSNVYVAGFEQVSPGSQFNNAVVWENGVKQTMQVNSTMESEAWCITVVGTDIYAGGSTSYTSNHAQGTYWKNGIITRLENDSNFGNVQGIAVVGSSLYTAGTLQAAASLSKPVYWQDGFLHTLTNPGYGGYALAITSSDTDVYIAGKVYGANGGFPNTPAYWKNGTPNYLPGQVGTNSYTDIAINGSDVYTAGFLTGTDGNNYGAYVKNGTINPVNGGIPQCVRVVTGL